MSDIVVQRVVVIVKVNTLERKLQLPTTVEALILQYAFESASRCGARTKGNYGKPCRCPAIRGKTRCRVHGGARG